MFKSAVTSCSDAVVSASVAGRLSVKPYKLALTGTPSPGGATRLVAMTAGGRACSAPYGASAASAELDLVVVDVAALYETTPRVEFADASELPVTAGDAPGHAAALRVPEFDPGLWVLAPTCAPAICVRASEALS